jgi:3-methyladenine DNA glycosylase AlkD
LPDSSLSATKKSVRAAGGAARRGAQFGVPLGDIRKVAAGIKSDHELAMSLWETRIIDAQLLATLLLVSKGCTSPFAPIQQLPR